MARTANIEVTVNCDLDQEYFEEWGELPPDLQEFWNKPENDCECNGTGNMGTWCHRCPFEHTDEEVVS